MAMAMAMATPTLRIASTSPSFLPRFLFSTPRIAHLYTRQVAVPFFPSLVLAVPAIQFGLPPLGSILEGIWESILRAVPKKKTSHMKKRHRYMAGKALKDVTSLCKCPACGETKRMHYLCPHCASKLQGMIRREAKEENKASAYSA
ncbi:hypothetical protein B0H66DRAFT_563067 [Apodospora peruviana]|uniref:Large ribosomal subunit protein bL32m n=1 Tax=Apodospora peruviana TaxID=516989 RepID=A0AAE0M0K8_9PEZI|nr:hypothetical protein B0H66DRAFT_563067 [Apodospora peruviana]